MTDRNNRNLFALAILFLGVFVFIRAIPLSQFPEAEISNGILRAKIYLPDTARGYYQGTRFDWAGVIAALEYQGHSYFGQWYDRHDPKIHDAIAGPVESFDPLGFEDAKPGETFVKIGVGNLVRPDDKAYRFSIPYEVEDYGIWRVKTRRNRVEFQHELNDASGYSYLYRKTLKMTKGKAALVLEHSLKNTGKKKIETKVFNHNFFMIDNQNVGPGYRVTFPFPLSLTRNNRGVGDLVEIEGGNIQFLRPVQPGESVQLFLLGFSDEAKDYQLDVQNHRTGAGVRITSDLAISDLAFWAITTTLCPEPYQSIVVEPGQEIKWNLFYNFYAQENR